MKSKFRKAVAFLALAAGIGIATSPSALGQTQQSEQGIQGTWLFLISIKNCSTGAQIGQPFLSLLTFNQGGTLTETTANPMFFPAERGPGHGDWAVYGPHSYKAVSMALITANGDLVRTQTITQTIELLSANSLRTTKASVEFFKPDGTLLSAGCAAATAQRIGLPQ